MEVHLDDSRIDYLARNQVSLQHRRALSQLSGLAYADIDFVQTVELAVAHLAALGHTHVALLNHDRVQFDTGYGPAEVVASGVLQAAQEHGLAAHCACATPHPRRGEVALHRAAGRMAPADRRRRSTSGIIPGIFRAVAARTGRYPPTPSVLALVSSPRGRDERAAADDPGAPRRGTAAGRRLRWWRSLRSGPRPMRRCCCPVGSSWGRQPARHLNSAPARPVSP
ncbi:MAG: hypothetical protein R3A10_21020 [Caldilineaceae bacterium]